ncbi:MAG TPA: RNA methyltransferase [Puia sp.]|nr:RNA methyltransferase [Puia sp.]
MLVKSQVKYIQSLGQKKFRDEEGVFIAEGPKIVEELLKSPGMRPLSIYAEKEWLSSTGDIRIPAPAAGMSTASSVNIATTAIGIFTTPVPECIELKKGELDRISALITPNQVLAIFRKPVFPPPDLESSFSLLLDGIQDPGNLGTIIRIADWFGIRQIVCTPDSADAFSGKTVQSTMGSIARVQVIYEDPEKLIGKYPSLPVYAATLEGGSVYGMERTGKGMLVIGNESKGIRRELLQQITHHITIPRSGAAESLNAAVATGIILSHLLPQPA